MQLLRDEEKNKTLQTQRGISFEDVQICVETGKMVKIVNHHNYNKYPNQKILLINHNNYIYVVPFVAQTDWSLFLKTIYPFRTILNFIYQNHNHDYKRPLS